MGHPKVFADFHMRIRGRLRLGCIGTVEDLAQQQVVLRNGLPLTFYSEAKWKGRTIFHGRKRVGSRY
jgi:hypothetical protein